MTDFAAHIVTGRCGIRRRVLLFLLSGLFISIAAIPPVLAQTTVPDRAVAAHPHGAHLADASQRFGIPTTWITAVMRAESGGDVNAISPAGAMGLMQVMPGTWVDLRRRYGLGPDPRDPRDNILAGTAYLREMWDRYGSVAAMLAAYNAGPARFEEYRAAGRPLPAETRAYVAALAPVLLGARLPAQDSLPSRPLDWREAGIFVARESGGAAASFASPVRGPKDLQPSVPGVSDTLSPARPEDLFVARSGSEDRP